MALRYQCSPYHTGTALWPVAQQLGLAAGLEPADTEAAKLDKLEALLRRGVDDVGEAVPLVAALLGIDAGGRYPAPDLTPQQQRARTLAALVEQLLGLARRRPVLMVLEDAHWIDPTTLELVGLALDRIAGARVLMLLTSRPDNQPALGGHPHVTRLTLNRLGRGATEAIVARLAGEQALPPEVAGRDRGPDRRRAAVRRGADQGGARGRGGGAGGATVPASLHASLMARLDRVPGVKEVAQVAACIGREFAYPLLAAVSPVPEPELRAALDRLAAAELVFARGEPPEASYAFKHALVRDAAHESLLKARRQRAARPDRPGAGGALSRDGRGGARAARPALRRGGARRAGGRLLATCRAAGARALRDGRGGRAPDQGAGGAGEPTWRARASAARARPAARAGPGVDRREGLCGAGDGRAYARARELCRELGDVPELFPALYGRFVVHFQRGELAVAHEVARELLRSAEEQGETAAQVTGHRMVGAALYQLGRLAESRDHLETALALYDPVRDRTSAATYAIDSRVVCLSWLSHVLAILGYPEQALARDSEVLGVRPRAGASHTTLAYALCWGCIFHQLRPGPSERPGPGGSGNGARDRAWSSRCIWRWARLSAAGRWRTAGGRRTASPRCGGA